MRLRRPLIQILLSLLLLTQYAVAVHAAEHHLFDEPFQAAGSQCDDMHLQQPCGSLPDIIAAPHPAATAVTVATSVIRLGNRAVAGDYNPRAPPHPESSNLHN